MKIGSKVVLRSSAAIALGKPISRPIGSRATVTAKTKDHLYVHWEGDAEPDQYGYDPSRFEKE